jgi:hypothetical protein
MKRRGLSFFEKKINTGADGTFPIKSSELKRFRASEVLFVIATFRMRLHVKLIYVFFCFHVIDFGVKYKA